MSKEAYLIAETFTQDDYGKQTVTQTKKKVFVELLSVRQQEFFNASTVGFKPDYQANMFAPEYTNETKIEIDNVTYDIYRTYLHGDTCELYLRRMLANEQQ